jgi:hypothetical protein
MRSFFFYFIWIDVENCITSSFFLFFYFFFGWLITSATQLVLKAHKEAVDSLSGNGSAKLGTVATVVAAANSTALECSKEIEAAMQISLRNALGMMNNRTTDGPMDDKTILKVYNFQNFSCSFVAISQFLSRLRETYTVCFIDIQNWLPFVIFWNLSYSAPLHCLPLDVYSYKTCQISCPLPSIDCKF